jgi:ABC-type proline/glycine betaine transport system ATPase subunit
MKVDFPFRVTELEYEITTLPPSAPIILIGRSGTGKTTCCLYRLWVTNGTDNDIKERNVIPM